MQELDAYIDALRAMPNEAGDRVRAIDHADEAGLPPLEQTLAADLAAVEDRGEREQDWLLRHVHLTSHPALPGPYEDAPNRLAQAVANLRTVGLWPWE